MSDDEIPFPPGASAEADGATPKDSETPEDNSVDGKLIHADVFLSRLAERRQAELERFIGGPSVIDTILGALEDIGLDPNTLAPDFGGIPHVPSQEDSTFPDSELDPLDLEALAVENLFLSELRDGPRPSLGDYIQRYPAQWDALRQMVARMDPRELAGLDAPAKIAPDQEAAARAGQKEGTRNALREASKRGSRRGRSATGRVAEERTPYAADKKDRKSEGKPGRGRSRPARPEEPRPER